MECMKLAQILSQIKKAFKKKTKLERFLIILSILLFIIFIIFLLIIIYGRRHSEMEDVCISSNCMKQVTYMKERMNSSINPCEDFYQFACGLYPKIQVVSDDERIHGVANDIEDQVYRIIRYHLESDVCTLLKYELENAKFLRSRTIRKAKTFYSNCMKNAESFKDIDEQVEELLQEVNKQDLKEMMAKMSTFGSNPFLDISIREGENSHTYHLTLSKPKKETKLAQMKESIYRKAHNGQNYISFTIYEKLIRVTEKLLGVEKTPSKKDIDSEMMEFERTIVKNLSVIACDAKPNDTCDFNTRKQEFAHEILRIFNGKKYETKNINAIVHDTCPSFTAEILCKYLNEEVAKYYLLWRHIMRFLPLLSTSFRRAYMEVFDDMNLENNIFDYPKYFPERWKQCVHTTNHVFGLVVAYLLKETEFDYKDVEEEISSLVESAKEIFVKLIYNQDWLDDEVKKDILVKLGEMKGAVGGPSILTDRLKIKSFYSNIKSENFLDTLLANEKNSTNFKSLNKDRIEESWFLTTPPISSEVTYNSDHNVLVVPMGALRFPYFIPDYFKFSKYGSIGTLISQALYSSFALEDMLSPEGNFSGDFLDEYRIKKECYRYQYLNDTKLELEQENLKKHIQILISDNVALKVAFALYMNDLDEEVKLPELDYDRQQLFFIQYAQTYCEVANLTDWEHQSHVLAKHRVNNVLSNTDEFLEAFSCSEKSAMYREDKCEMWE